MAQEAMDLREGTGQATWSCFRCQETEASAVPLHPGTQMGVSLEESF